MEASLKLGNGNWATKEDSLLSYGDENGNFRPLPFDFTRGSTATVINKAGLMETVDSGIARIDFQGTADGSLLLEPASTNKFLYSNDFSEWNTASQSLLIPNQSGVYQSTTAWKFSNATSTSSLYVNNTDSGVQTMSVYVKKNSNNGIRLFSFGSTNSSAFFNLKDGEVYGTPVNAISAKVTDVGNDWFRCEMTFDHTNTRCDLYVTNNGSVQVKGEVVIQLAQLEALPYATSYIPTNGTAVTRAAEVCDGAGDVTTFNSAEGVLYVEMAALTSLASSAKALSINDGTSTNRVTIYKNANTANYYTCRVYRGGGSVVAQDLLLTDMTLFSKIAILYGNALSDGGVYIDGARVIDWSTIDTSFTSNVLNSISFDNGNGGDALEAKIKQVQVFKTALTGAELQTLTTL